MSSNIDPAKLKVVELRAELSKRGLDSKGNKPALVKRLKDALEEELKEEIPDTSIADTSTSDLDSSQNEKEEEAEKEPEPEHEPEKQEEATEEEAAPPPIEKPPSPQKQPEIPEEEKVDDPPEQSEEPATEQAAEGCENGQEAEPEPEPMQTETKTEKRRHSSASPERTQRRRSRSPVKEDEPPIDGDKVQLSWYDSDLHLQVDKESFLSAKPYHDGAFGYAWAGVRATHGVNSGKVCFEVKITEELKWEDFSKYYDKHRQRTTSRHSRSEEEKKRSESEDVKPQNGEKTEQEAETPKESEQKEAEDNPEKPEASEEKESDEKTDKESDEKPDKEPEEKPEQEAEKAEKEPEDIEMKETSETEADKAESKEQIEAPIPSHLFRVGWSLLDTGLQLGEQEYSYGYESSGQFVTNKLFRDYGTSFGVGDVVTSFLSFTDTEILISYAVNGVDQSEAVSIPLTDLPENFVLFPHVLSRNYAFELNLGGQEEAWFALPQAYQLFEFLDKVENKVAGPARPENRSDCEVILMCGLPAAGKTHWVKEHVRENPQKNYTVLGNTHLLEKMTVCGDALKNKFKGSWEYLLEKLEKSINKLVEIAALRRRNYIIDQTNVYPSAQRRKLRPFEGFKRRAVVVVVGDEEQAKRQSKQEAEGGKDDTDNNVLNMKANMSLPQKSDWIDEIEYVGVGEEEAKQIVQKYNSQGREGMNIQRRFSHRDDRHRWQNRRNDYRGGNYRDRNYHNRYDRGPPRQGWHNMQRPGWNRDRRDRGPPPRDWRPRPGGGRDRPRDGQSSNYNRNRNPPPPPRNYGGWGGQGHNNWGGSQGQSWGGGGGSAQSWGQGQSYQNNQQWKYGGGGGQGYGGYSNWNYYGQYAQQGWQGQTNATDAGAASGGGGAAAAGQYGQYSTDWAQYAQQYAQQGGQAAAAGAGALQTQQPAPQK